MTPGILPLLVIIFSCQHTSRTPSPSGARLAASEGARQDLAATLDFFATRPEYERAFGTGLLLPSGLSDLSAATCAACHAAIADDWHRSVHAQAWIDPQFQAEIQKSDNRWLCLNCHTPLLTQQEYWPRGLVENDVERPVLTPNQLFNPSLREEGITCVACHLRERDGVATLAGPGLSDPSLAPHAVEVDPDLRSGRHCERCHDVQATYAGKSFICTFETGAELRAGPWDDPPDNATCVSCHMPPVERPAATGGPDRTVAQHFWRGAGIPKLEGRYPPESANPHGLNLSARFAGDDLILELENVRAGHKLPTGDPERWIQVDVLPFAEDTGLGPALTTRIGQEWEWTTPPVRRSDNRLSPKERREVTVTLPPGTTRVEIVAGSYRISEENAAFHHLGDYPRGVETHRIQLAR